MFDLLLRHINAEQYAAHAYRALASWADANGYPGLRGWADAASEEEQRHALVFIAFARTRGLVRLLPLDAPPDVGDYAAALEAALTIERGVAASLEALAQAGDEAAAQLAGDYLLTEQWPAIHEIEIYLLKARRSTDLDLLDAELFEEGA